MSDSRLTVEMDREARLLSLIPRANSDTPEIDPMTELEEPFRKALGADDLALVRASVALTFVGSIRCVSAAEVFGDLPSTACATISVSEKPVAFIAADAKAVRLSLAASLGLEAVPQSGSPDSILTSIERRFAGFIFNDFLFTARALGLEQLKAAQLNLEPASPEPGRLNSLFPASRFDTNLGFGGWKGLVSVFLSDSLLAKSVSETSSGSNAGGDWTARLSSRVRGTRIGISAELPFAKLTLSRIEQIVAGDVMELPTAMEAESVQLKVRGHTLCRGQLGKSGGHYSIKISGSSSQ